MTNRSHVLDVAFDLFRARTRLLILNAVFATVMLATRFAMTVDPFLGRDYCDGIRIAEFIAPRLFTIENARAHAREHIRTATFALSWVTLTPFRYYVPMAVLVAPFRSPVRLVLRVVRGIVAVIEFVVDMVRTGGAMLAVLLARLEKMKLPRPTLPLLRRPSLRRKSAAPQLSRRLTTFATLVLPAADRDRFAEEWHGELFVHSRFQRALLVIGIWRKLPAQAWRLRTYSRRQAIR